MANGGVAATGVWEVRCATGSDNNGGGFDPSVASPGTDFSQQAAAQIAYTDLVIGATTTHLTSVANPFTSVHVGNFIQITGGTNFTKNIYEVLSVSAGVAVMSTSVGTAAATGGTGNLGGALATLKPVLTRAINSIGQGNNGNTIYMTGTQTVTSEMDNYDLTFFSLIGYGTTRGDNGQATITASTNINLMVQSNAGQDWQFFNIRMTCTVGATASNSLIYDGGNAFTSGYFENCFFSGQWALYCNGTANQLTYVNCEITGCNGTTGGISTFAINVSYIGCYIHDNTGGTGVTSRGTNTGNASGRVVFIDCVLANNTGNGFKSTFPSKEKVSEGCTVIFWNCAIVNNTSDGINIVPSGTNYAPLLGLFNTIIYLNGGYGVNVEAGAYTGNNLATLFGKNNAYFSNTSGARNNFPTLSGDIVLTGDPFTNKSAGDYSLNNTAGAGAACKAAGWQNVLV